MKKKKLRCYIYVRVSTSMQVDGYSLEAQRDRLIKFAEFQEMEVVREYCDAGKSGKNISGRPEFSQMLQDIAEDRDRVDFILVFKLSRFGRNAADRLLGGLAEMDTDDIGGLANLLSDSRASGGVGCGIVHSKSSCK